MRTLASSNIPSESSPQTHSRPSPAVCVAGCRCCTGATGCPDGRLPRCHLTPSGHLPKKWILGLDFNHKENGIQQNVMFMDRRTGKLHLWQCLQSSEGLTGTFLCCLFICFIIPATADIAT